MSEVTFYHHERADGGRRTGIEFDDYRGLEYFQETSDEDAVDPTLLWFVDVKTTAPAPIETVPQAATWLAEHTQDIQQSLSEVADQLTIGFDMDSMASSYSFELGGRKYDVEVGGQNRIVRRKLGERLREFSKDLNQIFSRMKPYQPLTL